MSDEEQKAEARNVGNRPPLPTDAVAGTTGHIDAHNRLIDAIEDLRTIQDGKAEIAHSHSIPNVTGLQAALDGKAPTAHTHAQYLESTEVVAGANVTVDRTTLPGSVIINSQAGGMSQGEADARYLSATEIVAGNNITVDSSTTPGSVIISGTAGGGGGLDQTTADERYINVSGDSMTGPLQIAYGSDNSPSLEVRGKAHVLGYLGVGYDWDGVGTISLDDANGDLYISPGFGDTSYGAIKLDAGGAPALLTGLKNPVGASDAANKAYVDSAGGGGGLPPGQSGVLVVPDLGSIPPGTPAGTVVVVAASAPPPVTRPTIVSFTKVGSSAGTFVLSRPTGMANGDLLLFLTGSQVSTALTGFLQPSGFVDAGWAPQFPAPADLRFSYASWKRVTDAPNEPTTYTFTTAGSGGARSVSHLLLIRGAHATTPIGAAVAPVSRAPSNLPAIPGATVPVAGCLAIGHIHTVHSLCPDNSHTTPSGWTLLDSSDQAPGTTATSSTDRCSVYTKDVEAGTLAETQVVSNAGGQTSVDAGFLVVVRPA